MAPRKTRFANQGWLFDARQALRRCTTRAAVQAEIERRFAERPNWLTDASWRAALEHASRRLEQVSQKGR